jgi:hypothetical protein
MAKLEDLTPGTSFKGILPDALVTVVSVQWHGSEAIELTYQELDRLAGRRFTDLKPIDQPPCIAESGGFKNESEWVREFDHPYQGTAKASDRRAPEANLGKGCRRFRHSPVPVNWMLRESQKHLDECLLEELPPDEESPFDFACVFSRHRQEALCETFFGRLSPGDSLVFFYSQIAGLL